MTKQELTIKLVVSTAKITNLTDTLIRLDQLQNDTKYLLLQEKRNSDKIANDLRLELLLEEACEIVSEVN